MAIGDLAQLVLHLDAGGPDRWVNTFGFRQIGAGGTFSNLATAFETAVVKNTSGGILFGTRTPFGSDSLRIHDVVPGSGAVHDHTYVRVNGNVATSTLANPSDALVIKWTTALAGRSYRGRTYYMGMTAADSVAGTWQSGVVANAAAFVAQLLANFGATGTDPNWQFVIISRFTGGVERPTPTAQAVVAGIPSNVVRNQRRRQLGVGS